MPRSKQGVKRNSVVGEAMKEAVTLVVKEKCAAADKANVSESALHRHLKKFAATRDGVDCDNFVFRDGMDVNKMFDSEKEGALKQYIVQAAEIYHGPNIKEVKTLAYGFAKANNLMYPTSWDNKERAGETWYYFSWVGMQLFLLYFSENSTAYQSWKGHVL